MATSVKRAARCTSPWITLGHLLALLVTPANEQERAQAGELAEQVQEATQRRGQLACGDQGLQRARNCRRHRRTQHRVRSRQTGGSQARLRAPAPALGSRKILCLARAFSPLVARLRTACQYPRRAALACFFVPFTEQLVQNANLKFMTGSSGRHAVAPHLAFLLHVEAVSAYFKGGRTLT